jgi:hypothetical protein
MQKSCQKINHENHKTKFQQVTHHRQTKSFAPEWYSSNPSLKKLLTKAGKLKNRIEPNFSQKMKVENKLDEIMQIMHIQS